MAFIGGIRSPLWSIGIFTGDSPLSLAAQVRQPVLSAEDISDVSASFVADPFMLRTNGKWHMFFEIMSIATGRGEIGYATSVDGLCWQYSGSVLHEPFHLSYPLVFEWGGEYFMLPETLSENALILYQAHRFPFVWRPVAKLVEGLLADATLFRFQEMWWIFACSTPYQNDTLRLYYSRELMGGWTQHPRSPVIEGDSRAGRPGGRVIGYKGRLIRYVQDCEKYYGHRLRAYEITRLTPTEYAECECAESPVLCPGHGWNSAGMHHIDPHLLDSGSWLACVDGHRFQNAGGSITKSLAEWVRWPLLSRKAPS